MHVLGTSRRSHHRPLKFIFNKNGALTTAGVKFSLALTKQSLFNELEAAGFPVGNAKALPVTLPVTIIVGTSGFHADVPVTYSATAGKTGTAKK